MHDNLFANIPEKLPLELTSILAKGDHARIERIVSLGHQSPDDFWYEQAENEWVMLICGAARLQFENLSIELKPGDHLVIPAGQKHRVEWTAPYQKTIWLAVFYR